MGSRICYLERSELGGLIRSARLITEQADERWELGDGETDAGDAARAVSGWIAERLRAVGGRHATIDVLCIDVDGGACSWVSAPSADPRVVEAIIRQGPGLGEETDFAGSTSPSATLGADVDVPGAATLQPLVATTNKRSRSGAVDARRRLAVLAIPDAAVRVVIDELDRVGIDVGHVMSYWHAVAQAWDPSAEKSRAMTVADDRVVSEDEPTTASVVIDPAGRLIWTWSRGGELLTAGAMRLVRGGDDNALLVSRADVGRLAAEWLAWSAQLGQAPSRVVCVAPESLVEDGDSLGASGLGAALGQSWPGAAVDMGVVPDPVGATLERVAQRVGGDGAANPRTTLVGLSNRPGRSHRSMFIWLSTAILAASGVCGVVAVRTGSISTKTDALVRQIEAERLEIVQQAIGTEAAAQPDWMMQLRGALRKERKALQAGLQRNELMPVMQELETVSFVIGYPDFELRDLSFGQLNASFTVTVPSIEQYEQLRESLRYVAGSSVNWSAKADEERGSDRVRVRCQGQWIEPDKDGQR